MRLPASRNFERLNPASEGTGPLLQRDYWAVIVQSRLRPSQVISLLMRNFADFPPDALARFSRVDGTRRPLRVGDEMWVNIRMAGDFRVRVLQLNRTSFTLGTIQGHPEAGKITFGAYRNDMGDVIFHIRSRARCSSRKFYIGFLALGDAMQTETWTEFVERVALSAGEGVLSGIHAEKATLTDVVEESWDEPTFIARSD